MPDHTRRTVLKLAGASTVAVAGAGCTSGDESAERPAEVEIAGGETITLDGHVDGWRGAEPDALDGETNPTLVLEDGAEYEIRWRQGDGKKHNIVLWDENGDLVDEAYRTERTADPEETIAFTATEDLAFYRCVPHRGMQGEIRVV